MRPAGLQPIPVNKVEYERYYEAPEKDSLYETYQGLRETLLGACEAARKLPNLRVMELAHVSPALIPFIYIFTYISHGPHAERE